VRPALAENELKLIGDDMNKYSYLIRKEFLDKSKIIQ
jgi:hypothetical protein